MAVDLDYFRRCRDSDPSYKVDNAIVEYLSKHFEEARWLANQICDLNNDSDRCLLSYSDVYEMVEDMSPIDAYEMGHFSEELSYGDYYYIDGDGFFQITLAPWNHVKDILYDGYEDIVNGEFDISDELQSVIDVFQDDVSSKCIKRTQSKSSAKKPATKSNCAKKPASKAKQSNNRKPRTTAGKKPAPRRR